MTADASADLPWVEPEDFFAAHAAGRERAYWLDGSGARSWSGRLSVVGWLEPADLSLTQHAGPQQVVAHRAGSSVRVGSDLFAALAEHSGPQTPSPSPRRWVGFFGYAARPDLPALTDDDPEVVDSCWMRVERFVVFDHAHRRVRVVATPERLESWRTEVLHRLKRTPRASPPEPSPPVNLETTWSADRYRPAFDEVQRQLRLGNSYETNLTFRTTMQSNADPLDVYRLLRRLSPAPYAAFIAHRGTSLLSSSPERFATITAEGVIETRPIKGTTARHTDPALDARAARRLTQEPKFRGENLMIVDLLRNDMARVCELGSVHVSDLMHVESYPTVHQLVTTIEGRLRSDVTTIDALRALFPGGSMTGAPKLRTMQIIADVEDTPRGPYAGAVGWLLDDGSADLGIVIRSLVHRGHHYTVGTGGGITVSSVVEEEMAEASWKVTRMLAALGISPVQ